MGRRIPELLAVQIAPNCSVSCRVNKGTSKCCNTVVSLYHRSSPLGTKINWTASLKPPDHVRQEWASAPHNLPHLAPGSKLFDDALAAVCNRLGVSTGTVMSGPNANLLQGCHKLGLHAEELPRNCLSKKCSAYCNFGCRSGHKQSSDVCWLVDAVRAGAQVLTGVEGHRVLTQQQVAAEG